MTLSRESIYKKQEPGLLKAEEEDSDKQYRKGTGFECFETRHQL